MPYVFYDKPCVFFGVPKRLPEVVNFLSEMQEKFHRMLKLVYWMRRLLFGKGGRRKRCREEVDFGGLSEKNKGKA